uniref:thioredoxin-dependent peroxiredoxin n=1 Tax=Drosophila melanogaster TaxID=7227 RepID=Q8SY26_DROME|nr:RE05501p [Drosophila melanogaster]
MRLGQTVPNFEADTTKGPIKFHEWQGNSWVVLFSHPADFTPVCTTELGRIAVHQPEFAKRNTKCLAHSVDALNSHVDWVNDIKSYCLDIPGDFPYPIIADPTRDLAVTLGMLDEEQKKDPRWVRPSAPCSSSVRTIRCASPCFTPCPLVATLTRF